MKVGVVANCLNTPHIRGMGRYVQEILRHASGERAVDWRLYGENPSQPLAVPDGVVAERDVFTFRGDRFHLWEQLGLPMHARRDGIDVLHCTEGSLPRWQPVPTVVTVHDTLAWEENESGGVERFYFDRLLPAAMARCARIVTISESSARDIGRKWPDLAAKVVVIPHGIGPEYLRDQVPTPGELQRRLGDRPYIVYLGGPMKRKRFDWALRVLAACDLPGLQLVACGFGADTHDAQRRALPAALRERVHFAPFLSDDDLRALYGGAVAALYPTLYEGFGFPVVESQAAGAPILYSALGSLAELEGPLSMVCEAEDLPAWCRALREAHDMGAGLTARRAEARAWAHRFSWQRSCSAHLAVYAQAMETSRR